MSETTPRPWWRRVLGSTWFHLAAALVVTGLILSFVAKPYWVPSGSMEATLQPGDRVLVNRLAYLGASPATGDVVVFDAGPTWDIEGESPSDPIRGALRWVGEVTGFGPSSAHTLVKRVIAAPGQTVECCSDDGRLLVDGEALDEPYVTNDFPFEPGEFDCDTTPRSARCLDPITVPADSYLMLGDNRANSSDSAAACRSEDSAADCWRWAVRSDIVGKAALVFWPFTRWSAL
ncbi:signal peptidase I [Microbacterium sp. cf046]|uniref:signal peptidase I n=1 Tax=Microbacterium sp. cf046 TaxID=1761803 RepID=UPI0008E292B6|nr:signal peptidase I [Microbacterium sp. cf046]SFR94592.1 signal peptidase I [Microbacterium sp. cf046]